jgi:phosphohistidine phosphatase
MDLILWRHADAEPGAADLERKLTSKGHKQAAQMAAWLRRHLPEGTRILVSPAARAQQTAKALRMEFETVHEVGPGASCGAILRAAEWPDAKGAVLVVGHQPSLGQVAAMLLADEEAEWSIKKGGIFWLSHRGAETEPEVALRAVLSPDLV